jgi:hypothetical protein
MIVGHLHIFLLDVYAQDWHEGVGGIPTKRWTEGIQAGFMPMLPPNAADLRILLARTAQRTIGRAGIEFASLRYNSPDLQHVRSLLAKDDRDVPIKYDPSDLGVIYVFDPSVAGGRWLHIPALDADYAVGLSLSKHRVLRRYVLAEKHEVDVEALAAAKAHIQQLVAEEFILTRKARGRLTAARFLGKSVTSEPANTGAGSVPRLRDTAVPPPPVREARDQSLSQHPEPGSTPDTSDIPQPPARPVSPSANDAAKISPATEAPDSQSWGADYNLPATHTS